jgi:hypothetical protein
MENNVKIYYKELTGIKLLEARYCLWMLVHLYRQETWISFLKQEIFPICTQIKNHIIIFCIFLVFYITTY